MKRERLKTRYPGVYTRGDRLVVWFSDSNGIGHTKTLPPGSLLEDARLFQASLMTRKSQGETIIVSKITVSELLDEWLLERSESLTPGAIKVYSWAIEKHIKPAIGRRKVRDLSVSDVLRLRRKLVKAGLKKHSISKIETPLKNALLLAVRDGIISSNPYSKLLSHESVKRDQKEMQCLSKNELSLLLKHSSNSRKPWKTLFATLIFTGLRISEALSLEWSEVDFEKNLIHVRSGKTPAARRSVVLMPALGSLLRALKLQQDPGVQSVFPVSYWQARSALALAEKRAGIPKYSLHELRHTFASILIGQGELPTFVASQMGHSGPEVTMRVYVHLWEKEESVQRATERLQEAFGGMV